LKAEFKINGKTLDDTGNTLEKSEGGLNGGQNSI